MRLWSLHPENLDVKGLVALWREALLAKKVLEGNTKGYKNHPQLIRFNREHDPAACINTYLTAVYDEALRRGYRFSAEKIGQRRWSGKIKVTTGQVEYETKHLLRKLKVRDRDRHEKLKSLKELRLNPLFEVTSGEVEEWEVAF